MALLLRLCFVLSVACLSPAFAAAEIISNVPCVNGEAAGFPCAGVDLLAHVPVDDLDPTGGELAQCVTDLWGWRDGTTGKEYAVVGICGGTAVVDVSEPTDPHVVGLLPSPDQGLSDVKVYRDHAFVSFDEAFIQPIQVFDLRLVRGITGLPMTFGPVAVIAGTDEGPHNIAINEQTGFLYAVGEFIPCGPELSGGIYMVDISSPAAPTFAGCAVTGPFDGYHDLQCVIYQGPDVEHRGSEICFVALADFGDGPANGLDVIDVTNKSNTQLLSRTGYPNSGFGHQVWLTPDQRYALYNDEADEFPTTKTHVFDIADLDAVRYVGAHVHGTEATAHNLFIKDNLVYESNYRAGLRILELGNLANASLSEVAFFDTHPFSDVDGFSGSFSNYPFLPSGNILVSDIQEGLFVLRHGSSQTPPPTIQIVYPTQSPTFTTSEDTQLLSAIATGEVTSVSWRNETNGATGEAILLFGWMAINVPLAVGENQIRYTATGPGGTATDLLTVERLAPISVQILLPTQADTFSTEDASIHLIANVVLPAAQLESVRWRNAANGVEGDAIPFYGWVALNVPLVPGQNPITYTATALNGSTGSDTLTITRATVPINKHPKGVHDGVVDCRVTAGWTCDPDNFAAPVQVQIWEGSQLRGTVLANQAREPGVATACGGNNLHGFEYTIPSSMKDGNVHSLVARAVDINTGTVVDLQNNPVQVQCGQPDLKDPKGSFDGVYQCKDIYGWACDGDNWFDFVRIQLRRLGGAVVWDRLATVRREPGVQTACGNSHSDHGFVMDFPSAWKDGQTRSLRAFAQDPQSGAWHELQNSPRTFSCGP